MSNKELLEKLQEDLKNERKHLAFYTQAAVMVSGLHRQELREYFEKEAASELQHVIQFSELIVQLDGVPNTDVNDYISDVSCPVALLKYAVEMEEEVARNYTKRLKETDKMEYDNEAYVHLFYEEQLLDSWKAAKEVKQMVKSYDKTHISVEECTKNREAGFHQAYQIIEHMHKRLDKTQEVNEELQSRLDKCKDDIDI